MKNFWLKKKSDKEEAAKAEEIKKASEVYRRKVLITKYGKSQGYKSLKAAFDADKCTSKTCLRHAKFLQYTKDCFAKWAKLGLLEGIENKCDRAQTAVLLEGQRLMNEQKYNLYARTTYTGNRHGFNTLEELFQYIHVLESGEYKNRIAYGGLPDGLLNAMILTVTENWGHPDAKDISYDCMIGYKEWEWAKQKC